MTVDPLYGFTGWYDGNVLLSESKDFEFVARRSMDIVAKIKRVVHNTGFSRYTSHCNDVWDIVPPALYRIDYVNGVRPKSVQFYYRVNSIGGDHGYLWTTSTFSGSVDQNFSQTVASSTGQGGTKILTAALKFYDTYFTLQGNMSFSCREDFVGTMIYD